MRFRRVSLLGVLLLFVVVCLALPVTATAYLREFYIGGGRLVFVQTQYADDAERDVLYTWKSGDAAPVAIAQADPGGYYSVMPSPRAEGDRVAWTGWRHSPSNPRGSEQSWLWTPSTLTALTEVSPYVPRFGIAIAGDRIMWRATQLEPGNRTSVQIETFMLGDAEPLRVTSNINPRAAVRMGTDRIVWRELLPQGDWQVMTWKAGDTSPTQLTSGEGFHGAARVSGDRVIWYEDPGRTTRELYTWKAGDAEPTLLATVNPWWGRRIGGRLSGERVVWRERETEEAPWQVFTWKAGDAKPTQLTNDDTDHAYVRVSGDRLVWVSYPNEPSAWYRPTHSVYTWKVGEAKPTKLTSSAVECGYLSVSGDQVVWVEQDTEGDYTQRIMTWSPGQTEPLLLKEEVTK